MTRPASPVQVELERSRFRARPRAGFFIAMNRDEKTAVVEEVTAQIKESEAIFAIDYRGISVSQAAELRSRLRDADASFRVVKNRLTKIAAKEAGREELDELLNGPTALTFVRGDTAMAAKAITGFNREHDVLTFKGGYMEGLQLDEARFTSIAKLPSRDVLNGQFAGVVASPLTGLVRGLGGLISGLALQLGQIAEQGLVTGEAPAPEAAPAAEETPEADATPPADEAPAEEKSPAEEDAPAEEAPGEAAEEPVPDSEQPEASTGEGGTPNEEVAVEEDSAGSSAEEPAAPDPSQAEGDDDAGAETSNDSDEEQE